MLLECGHEKTRQASEHPTRGIAWLVEETVQYVLFLRAMKMIIMQIN